MNTFKFFVSSFLVSTALLGAACSEFFDPEMEAKLDANEDQIATLTRHEACTSEFMPLHVIPEFAKDRMTPEELRLWETMSAHYNIDYSFLETDLQEEQKTSLYASIRTICELFESGKETGYAGYFAVQRLFDHTGLMKLERLTRAEVSPDKWVIAGPITIFELRDADARVKVTASCGISNRTVITVTNANAYAAGKAAISFHGNTVATVSGPEMIKITCAGTLKYQTEAGILWEKDFNQSVTVKVI